MSPAVARVAVIGGGPAGLMAAERLSTQGVQVDVFDAMPSVGRKFLMAGRGGLLGVSDTDEALDSPILLLTDPRDPHEVLAAREGPVLLAVLDDRRRGRLPHPRERLELL